MSIHTKKLSAFPVRNTNADGCINPFLEDFYNMGTSIGKNVMILHDNHTDKECTQFVVVNRRTGDRLLITIGDPITYPLKDRLSLQDLGSLGLKPWNISGTSLMRGGRIMAILTGEKRSPKKGEWYLSGATPEAYKAPNDLTAEYHILRLVKTRTVELT